MRGAVGAKMPHGRELLYGSAGSGDGFILGTGAFLSRVGSFLKAREQTAARGPEVPRLASLVNPCLAQPGHRSQGGSTLAGFLPITSLQRWSEAPEGSGCQSWLLPAFSGDDDIRTLAHP